MDFSTLARIWRGQDSGAETIDKAEWIQRLHDDYRCRQKKLIGLNLREGIPCLLLSGITLAAGLTMTSGNWAFITASALFLVVAVFLTAVTIRYQISRIPYTDSVKQSLQRSLAQARHHEWLYGNVVWWYLLPIVVAWGVIVYETMLHDGVSTFAAVYISLGVIFFLMVGWLNRQVAINQYRPLREQLELLVQQCTDENDAPRT